MGHPIHAYSHLREIMGFLIVAFSIVLLLSEAPSLARVVKGSALFLASGLLGSLVLMSYFSACQIPEAPWIHTGYLPRSSLLLPLFAGLFGIPSLFMSMGSRRVFDIRGAENQVVSVSRRLRDYVFSILGGMMVGWLPGMTSGSSATLCSPRTKEITNGDEVSESARFIWLYSFISASGAVFAVGALFVILRARSGSMDAVQFFLGDSLSQDSLQHNIVAPAAILLSMVLSAHLSRQLVGMMFSKLDGLRNFLCSRAVAALSLLFISALSVALTGTRGAMVLSAAVCLGLLPTRIGVRRIQLMGCLLVPIAIGFFTRN
jgi:putative membrane protein